MLHPTEEDAERAPMLRHDNESAHTGGILLQFPIGRVTVAPPVTKESEFEIVGPIPFQALCGDHLLPFDGVVHVGYVRGRNQLHLSEFNRVVDACSGGIQAQQWMTTRIALWLHNEIAPRGLGVLVEGDYGCATAFGGAAVSRLTTTMAFYGSLRRSAEEQREFLALARKNSERPESLAR
ncbi:hypothetical protein GAN17_24620 [Mycobacterium kubicae]|uniref:GTP cyclohydrolase I n=1 Tax=Mycobacterium kubicae TaxID=120959 RepID=UPI0016401568|nr:GTP cyclohydrolase I [Mycobacterium kubicae]QNI09069.1 hypothetical protein GAN17_24620 [Mycobacterium kubicae]